MRGRVHVSLEKSRRQSIQDSQDNQVLGGLGDPVLGGWGGKIHVIEIWNPAHLPWTNQPQM